MSYRTRCGTAQSIVKPIVVAYETLTPQDAVRAIHHEYQVRYIVLIISHPPQPVARHDSIFLQTP